MNIDLFLQISQGFFALTSVGLILLQPPSEDARTASNWFSPQVTKRGWEKIMFIITISSIVCFTLISVFRLILV